MQIDAQTASVIGGLVVILCGVTFVLNTAFNRNDAPGRFWSVSFIAGIIVAVGFVVSSLGPMEWGNVVGNVAAVVAIGSYWTGSRLYNGRAPYWWIVGVIAVTVAIAAVWGRWLGEQGAGAPEPWLSLALVVLGGLGGSESMRGRLGRNLNGRILGVTLWSVSAASLARAIVAAVDGPTGAVFTGVFRQPAVPIVSMALVVTATIAMSILCAEGVRSNAVGDLAEGIHSAAGVLSARAFDQAAADHAERAQYVHNGIAIIGADIDNLREINTAFGRAAGDQAIARFAQTLRRTAPPMALIGHTSAGRFLVLARVASVTESRVLAERIQTSLVDGPLTESFQIRFTASFGIADSDDHGYSVTALAMAAGAAIDAVKANGGNSIQASSATG